MTVVERVQLAGEEGYVVQTAKDVEAVRKLGKRLAEAGLRPTLTIAWVRAVEPGMEGASDRLVEAAVCVAERLELVPLDESALRAVMDLANDAGFRAELRGDGRAWRFWPQEKKA